MASLSMTFCRHGNFGDKLNVSLANALGITEHRHAFSEQVDEEVSVLGIGTILTDRLMVSPKTKMIVFGSGFGLGQGKNQLPKSLDIRFLRGPLSCAMLKLAPGYAVSDSAYLFGPRFRELTQGVPKTRKIGFIPHYFSPLILPLVWKRGQVGENMIDPMSGINAFVKQVAGCERIVTEALHGAILADALRVPFTMVQTSPHFNSFKWQDWLASMKLELRLGNLGPEDVDGRFDDRHFQLSDDARLTRVETRIAEEFEKLKAQVDAFKAKEQA